MLVRIMQEDSKLKEKEKGLVIGFSVATQSITVFPRDVSSLERKRIVLIHVATAVSMHRINFTS